MKTLHFIILILFFGGAAFGQTQATATFTASVTIIEPIGITTTSDMNFASIDAKSGGTIVLTPDNDRLTFGGVELADGGNVSAATFQVTGEKGFTYSISLPKGEYLLINGNETVIIKDFTSNLDESGQLTNGASQFRVGASLEVKPGQLPGNYKSTAPIPVTVNYN